MYWYHGPRSTFLGCCTSIVATDSQTRRHHISKCMATLLMCLLIRYLNICLLWLVPFQKSSSAPTNRADYSVNYLALRLSILGPQVLGQVYCHENPHSTISNVVESHFITTTNDVVRAEISVLDCCCSSSVVDDLIASFVVIAVFD